MKKKQLEITVLMLIIVGIITYFLIERKRRKKAFEELQQENNDLKNVHVDLVRQVHNIIDTKYLC
jgi:preprotein translocase subunit YajC